LVLYGEICGASVQDLGYGVPAGEYRLFAYDLKVHLPLREGFLDPLTFDEVLKGTGIPVCPVLKIGPFTKDDLNLRLGKTTIPNAEHVREGIVIKPIKSRSDRSLGRVILKAISEDYDMRKGAKDY